MPVVSCLLALASLLVIAGCSINVKKNKNGEEQNVDIQTPVGGIHVNTDQKGSDGNSNKANVNISSSLFGVKVVAVEFLSDDPPEKIAAFYRDQLKRYGGILECHTKNSHGDAGDVDVKIGKDGKDEDEEGNRLACEDNGGSTLELKVGTKDNQHIVSISPQDKGKGTDFALVYVQTRGESKDTI
ncbi:MAG: hypothetical protein DMG81_04035 [Acidobacteria bacterium]|nr:MAG: hypothetical protein DMG81_04035 [Acidobacteriota bacterium]